MSDERREAERRKTPGRRQGEKLPYMPLYVDEWDSSRYVQRLSYEGQGVYMALLKHQWRDGSIPVEESEVRDLLGLPTPQFIDLPSLLDRQFPKRGGVRVNAKLATLRREALAKCKRARKSANVRWHSERIANAVPSQSERNAKKLSKEKKTPGASKEPSWLQRLGSIWFKAYHGEAPFGKLGKLLLSLKDDPELESRFTAYVNQTPARFVNLQRFVETYGSWGGKRRDNYLTPADVA